MKRGGEEMTSEFNVAVHALACLNHKNRTMSSEELAENICTNPARVRKVMAMLKKGGLVVTKEGIDGGYSIAAPADQITLSQISEATNVCFVSASWKSGDIKKECLIASGMGKIMEDIYGDLDRLCKERLQNITIHDIDKKIFRQSE